MQTPLWEPSLLFLLCYIIRLVNDIRKQITFHIIVMEINVQTQDYCTVLVLSSFLWGSLLWLHRLAAPTASCMYPIVAVTTLFHVYGGSFLSPTTVYFMWSGTLTWCSRSLVASAVPGTWGCYIICWMDKFRQIGSLYFSRRTENF